MTLVVDGDDQEVEQAGKQLYKLMEVLKVTDITDTELDQPRAGAGQGRDQSPATGRK